MKREHTTKNQSVNNTGLTEHTFEFAKRISKATFSFAAMTLLCSNTTLAQIPLHWIGDTPRHNQPVTLGIPFQKGELGKKQTITLTADNKHIPTDFRPLAFWADGSVKWGAVSAVVPANVTPTANIVPAQSIGKTGDVLAKTNVSETKQSHSATSVVNTGRMQVHLPSDGYNIMDSLILDGVKVAGAARIICSTQNHANSDMTENMAYTKFKSHIDNACVENEGDVRTCYKIEGRLLPCNQSDGSAVGMFAVRFYLYKGSSEIKVVHTFTYTGDQDKDFINSLGIQIEVPMREEAYNRHVAFATQEGGVWAESVQPLSGRRVLNNDPSLELQQVEGKRIADYSTFDEKNRHLLDNWAKWNSFRLSQPNDQGFSIQKRAHHNNSWIGTFTGSRAPGYAFVGDVSGGLGISLKDFWQSYPASLQIDSAATSTALLTCYMWSPDAPAMDLRHYDNVAHDLIASYEDVQPGMSTPYGIARTSIITLIPETYYPGKKAVSDIAEQCQDSPQLLPTAKYMHDKQAFGVWSLPDNSTPNRAKVEKQLTEYLDYFMSQQEQHHWYGFWNYGDFMHQYDPARHEWKYDVGGFAWDNTELGSNAWLWYSFLRTGRKDIWQAACAMTRHNSEVDVYHVGDMQGLGTRHNVSHWGCGAKEARISQAAWNRFMYYLTADERLGDLMTAVKDADQKLYTIDPMRLALPREKYPCTAPARLRIGPDWLAYAGNWMTEWERTGNIVYRKKIEAGMKSICKLPRGMFSGPGVLGFDPATGVLSWEGDKTMEHTNHLMTIMGGFEINHELMQLLPNKDWEKRWLEYCRDYQKKALEIDHNQFRVSRVKAYAAWKLNDKKMAEDVWKDMWTYSAKMQHYEFKSSRISAPQVPQSIDESPLTTTNDCALWSLEAIFMQEVIPQ